MAVLPKIIVTEPLAEEAIDWLSARSHVVRMGVDEDGFRAEAADADALIVRTYTQVNAAVLSAAPRLRVVGRAGTGLDNIDLAACEDRLIRVVHTPEANRQAVVEYVTSLLMNAFRPIPPPVAGGLTSEAWGNARRMAMAPRQLSECRVGILGMGQIGRRVAEVMAVIGCHVQFHDVVEIPIADRCGAESLDLPDLLKTSDVLSVHVDGRVGNHHFLGAECLAMMRDDAVLINTSRGFVVDSAALAAQLTARPTMRAILDVHEQEPIPRGAPLRGCSNAVLLPHAASRTAAAQRAMSWVVKDVLTALQPGA